MIKQIKKIILFLLLFLFSVSCSSYKERKNKEKENHKAYVNYLIARNIDSIKANDLDYYDDFFVFKKEEKRKSLLHNPYLKVNKVYAYQGPNKITFCVFSDDGNEYMTRVNKIDNTLLTEPENGIIKLKQQLKLEFLGNFELKDSIIKISRNERELSGKEWNEGDVGYLQNDTIRLVENYNTKKYEYQKKWLAKTYKTNYKLVYQPDLIVTRYEGDKTHNPYYLVEGSFKIEENQENKK